MSLIKICFVTKKNGLYNFFSTENMSYIEVKIKWGLTFT